MRGRGLVKLPQLPIYSIVGSTVVFFMELTGKSNEK